MDQVPHPIPVLIRVEDADYSLSQLLDRVERGETFVITRNGRAVARLSAGGGHDVNKAREAVAGLTALRKELAARGVNITQEEICAMRDEGRR